MDQGNNDAKVRIVVQISHIHNLKQWLTTFSNATLIAHTSYISIFVTKRITCWRFEWIMIMIIRIVIADKSNQQFETKSYHHPQCNSDHSHFLHFLHHNQAHSMREIWIDHFNYTKVRMVEDKSYYHSIWNNDLPSSPMQLWPLTLPTVPSYEPRYSHAEDLNGRR